MIRFFFIVLLGLTTMMASHGQVVTSSPCLTAYPSAPSRVITTSTSVNLIANPAPAGFSYRWYDDDATTQLATSQTLSAGIISGNETFFLAYRHNSSGCLSQKVPVRVIWNAEKKTVVKTFTARDSMDSEVQLRVAAATEAYKSSEYYDSLGRPKQSVAIQASVNGLDLISTKSYDDFGRVKREYLPFANNSINQGEYRPTATSLHSSYYSSAYGDSRGFMEKNYEASPLNRVSTQGVPGTPWISKGIDYDYATNTAQDSVRKWTVNSAGLPHNSTLFAPGTLSKIETEDENGQRTIEYKDKLGRLILKKVQEATSPTNHHDGWLCTYHVYDTRGRLRVIMPPLTVATLRASNKWFGSTWNSNRFGLYYMYSYDARGRVISKKLPGKAPEEYVYDLQDRLVASRDSLLISEGKWHYRKYDALGREVMTGLVSTSSSRSSLQNTLNSAGKNNAVINSTSGKSGATNAGGFPTSSEGEVLTVNYYDDYTFKKSTLNFSQLTGYPASSTQTHGLLTGKLVRNLDTGVRYESVYFYDTQGRLIQSLDEHHLSGTIRASTQFDFENNPIQTTSQLTGPSTQTIVKDYQYNQAGLLARITHKINSGPTVTLADFTYNNLGELTNKTFPVAGNAATSFTYNIRGWLKRINNPQVSHGGTQVFAQELFYETGHSTNNWNGNISKVDWRGKDNTKRTYTYNYDKVNRLTDADYVTPGETNRYTVDNMTYGANGNLRTLNRRNQRTTSSYGLVDQLTYTYPINGKNRLVQVADAYSSTSYLAKDFKNRSSTNYEYDRNGNLTKNLDKQINSITYNHLNLPQQFTFTGTNRRIEYQYTAEGVKVQQKNTDGSTVTTLNYLGEFVLEGSTMSYILHEEGRAALESGTYQYEFFVKDHLGNVRQVVRAPISALRIATMEPEKAQQEEEDFQNIKESRQGAGEHNKTPGGYATAWLNADRGRILGPSRSQEIQEGDSIEIGVFGKYVDPKKIRLSPVTFIRTGMDRKIIRTLGEYGQTLSTAPNEIAIANIIALVISELETKPAPEAYMGYALYDSDSVLYEQGKVVLSKKARNKHEELIQKLAVTKDGYIETFLVNETAENVWFDQFRIMSTGPLIVQETHYDPWGVELGGLGYQYGGIKVNPYLYNGKEANDHFDVNLYDYGARHYDPAIGRWFVLDPLAELAPDWTPFRYGFNNPMKYTDPTGMFEYSDGYSTQDSRNSTGSIGFSGTYSGTRSDLESGSSASRTVVDEQDGDPPTVVPNGGSTSTCCGQNSGSSGEGQSNGGSDGGSAPGALGWAGVGLGVVEEGANLVKSSQTVVVPVYNEAGKAIAGWNVISKQTGKVLKYVKAGASKGGYVLAGASLGFDAVDFAQGDLTGTRFSYHTLGTAVATGTAIYGTAGIGALVGGVFILGEHAYDGWMQNIQPQINQGASQFYNALQSGWRPFR